MNHPTTYLSRTPMLSLALGLLLVAPACESTGPSDDEAGTVEGRVSDGGSRDGVEGAIIVVSRVEANGELTALSTGVIETDANGEFAAEVFLEGGVSESDLVVTSSHADAGLSSVIVTGELAARGTVQAAPLTTETTVETDIFLRLHADGDWDSSVMNSAMLRAAIDASTAEAITASSSAGTQIQASAAGLASAMDAWTEMMVSADVGVSQTALGSSVDAQVQAQAELDAALFAADSSAEVQAAIAANAEAVSDGYSDASITMEQLAVAAAAESAALIAYSGSANAEVQASLVAETEANVAAVTAAAIEARLVAMGASQTSINAVAAAATQLETSIEASASAGASALADIDAAWAAFEAEVHAELESEVAAGISVAWGTVLAAVASADVAFDAAAAVAGTASSSEDCAAAIVAAVSAYRAAVQAESNATLLVTAGMSQADADASLAVLAILGASAR